MHNDKASTHREEHGRDKKPREKRLGPLCDGPPIPGHRLQYDEAQHIWVIDQVLLCCSASEYQCLSILFACVNRCVPFAQLLASLQEMPGALSADSKQERMRIAHLMSTLRPKIWAFGMDIVSVMKVGYLLLSETQESGLPDV